MRFWHAPLKLLTFDMMRARGRRFNGMVRCISEEHTDARGYEMNVKQLIEKLYNMPPEAEVRHLWDGSDRTAIEYVWLAKSGKVITADYQEYCYNSDARPVDAHTEERQQYWKTPSDPADI